MNRRNFLSTVAGAVAGFTILPPATTYQRVWRATVSPADVRVFRYKVNGVGYCLRWTAKGGRIVWTPYGSVVAPRLVSLTQEDCSSKSVPDFGDTLEPAEIERARKFYLGLSSKVLL